jgi:hypothetical protein
MVLLSAIVGSTGCDAFNAPQPEGFAMPTSNDQPDQPDPSTASDASSDGGSGQQLDIVQTLAPIVDGGYRDSVAFTHATRTPYPSTVATGSYIDEWVSTFAYAQYSKVQPDADDAGVVMPVGSMVVRAVVDENDVVSKLTVMFKGPSGYNSELGDWWFAETDPSGNPLTDDAGVLAGKLTECFGCHVPRSDEDFLFGVPLDDRPGPE